MDLMNLTFFKLADRKSRWLSQRQAVLAENIANADTPSYMPSDVKPLSFRELMDPNRLQLTVTNPAHFGPTNQVSERDLKLTRTNEKHIKATTENEFRTNVVRRPFETSIDKNGVVLEEQMAKVDETRSQHDMVANLFQKNISFIAKALGKGGGSSGG